MPWGPLVESVEHISELSNPMSEEARVFILRLPFSLLRTASRGSLALLACPRLAKKKL